MSSLACRRPPQKSIPLDAFGTRGSGKAAPLRWLHPRALGASLGFVALATPPFPLPPPWRLPAKHRVPLRAVHAHSAEDVQRGARKLLSEMFAQFLREESWLRFAAQAGRGSAPVPAFALSLRRPPASRHKHT